MAFSRREGGFHRYCVKVRKTGFWDCGLPDIDTSPSGLGEGKLSHGVGIRQPYRWGVRVLPTPITVLGCMALGFPSLLGEEHSELCEVAATEACSFLR